MVGTYDYTSLMHYGKATIEYKNSDGTDSLISKLYTTYNSANGTTKTWVITYNPTTGYTKVVPYQDGTGGYAMMFYNVNLRGDGSRALSPGALDPRIGCVEVIGEITESHS